MSQSIVVINGACQQFTYAGVAIDAIYKIILGVLFEIFFGEPMITFDDDLPYCTSTNYIQPLPLAEIVLEESMYFDFESDASTFPYLFLLQCVFGVLAMAGISSAAYDYARRRN